MSECEHDLMVIRTHEGHSMCLECASVSPARRSEPHCPHCLGDDFDGCSWCRAVGRRLEREQEESDG